MKIILFCIIILSSLPKIICRDWNVVATELDSIVGYTNLNDKIFLYNLSGTIIEVDINSKYSKLITKLDGLIFSVSNNQGVFYLSHVDIINNSSSILRSSDGGHSWEIFMSNFGKDLFFGINAYFKGDTSIYIGSNSSQRAYIIYSYDNGITNNSLVIDDVLILLTISSIDNKIFVGSGDGRVLVSYDYGQSWSEIDFFRQINNNSPVRGISFHNGIGFVSFQNGEIYKSYDRGISWQKINLNLTESFAIQHFNFVDSVIYGSGKSYTRNKGLLFMSKDNGDSWEIILEDDFIFRGSLIYDHYLYCISGNGNLWFTAIDSLLSSASNFSGYPLKFDSVLLFNNEIKIDSFCHLNNAIRYSFFDILGDDISDKVILSSEFPLIFRFVDFVANGVYFLLIDNGFCSIKIMLLIN